MLILAGLWFAVFISAAAISKSGFLSVVFLLFAVGGPLLLDLAVARGAQRQDWIGRYCRRQQRIYRRWWR